MAVDKKVADGLLRLILLKGDLGNCVFTGEYDRGVLKERRAPPAIPKIGAISRHFPSAAWAATSHLRFPVDDGVNDHDAAPPARPP